MKHFYECVCIPMNAWCNRNRNIYGTWPWCSINPPLRVPTKNCVICLHPLFFCVNVQCSPLNAMWTANHDLRHSLRNLHHNKISNKYPKKKKKEISVEWWGSYPLVLIEYDKNLCASILLSFLFNLHHDHYFFYYSFGHRHVHSFMSKLAPFCFYFCGTYFLKFCSSVSL